MFKNIKQDDDDLTFEIINKNIKLALPNALRRIMIAEIPMIAINNIEMHSNTSMLHNGILTDRLLLVPINYHKTKNYDLGDLLITLDITNNEDYMIEILTNKFTATYQEKTVPISDIFYSTEILYAKLKPNQRIHLTAKLIEDTAKNNHPSFSHVAKSILTFVEDEKKIDEITKDMSEEETKNYLNSEAHRIFIKTDRGEPAIYRMSIESIGVLSPKEIFTLALETLDKKLIGLLTDINNNNKNKIKIEKAEVLFDAFDFTIIDEDDTLGNLLVNYLKILPEVNFAGYIIPHPLDAVMIIRTGLNKNNTLETNKQVFINNIIKTRELVNSLTKDWKGNRITDEKKKIKTKKIKVIK